jgi:hypothetical protein
MIETIVKDYLHQVFDCALDQRIDGFAKFTDRHPVVALDNAFEESSHLSYDANGDFPASMFAR